MHPTPQCRTLATVAIWSSTVPLRRLKSPQVWRLTMGELALLGTFKSSALALISSHTSSHARRGFTLIEIAIVLVVIGLIVSGGLVAISPVLQSAKTNETKQKMATVESALLGYVIANGCLPCPALRGGAATGISNNGTADYTVACGSGGAGACTGAGSGLVPWVTLGISENDATDGWNRRMTFAVDPAFTNDATDVQRNADGSFPALASTLRIENLVGAGADLGYTSLAYILVSHGPDGAFGESFSGNIGADPNGTPADQGQNENGDNDQIFASGPPSNVGAGYFDDIISFKSFQPLIISCGAGSCGNPS